MIARSMDAFRALGHVREYRRAGFVQFAPEGTFLIRRAKPKGLFMPQEATGSWRVLDDGRLEMRLSVFGFSKTAIGTISFQDEYLRLTDEKGRTRTYRRSPSPP